MTRPTPRHAAPNFWFYFRRRFLWELRHPIRRAPWEAR